jgi:hypothetical protein
MCRMMIESERLSMLGLLARVSRPASRMFFAPVTFASLRSEELRAVPSRFCRLTVWVAVLSSARVATTDPPAARISRAPTPTNQRAQRGERGLAMRACGNVVSSYGGR